VFERLTGSWRSRSSHRKSVPALALASFVFIAGASYTSAHAWLAFQQSRSGEPHSVYDRGGAILFGRTEYAKYFDFSTQTAPFLVTACSESLYRQLYASDPAPFTWIAEVEYSNRQIEAGVSDEELYRRGWENLTSQPFRQGASHCLSSAAWTFTTT